MRDEIISKHTLDCLRYLPPTAASATLSGKGLPSETAKSGLVFCGEKVPVQRTDVRRRIEYQIAYLLTDFRDSTGIWLKRRDRTAKQSNESWRGKAYPGNSHSYRHWNRVTAGQ